MQSKSKIQNITSSFKDSFRENSNIFIIVQSYFCTRAFDEFSNSIFSETRLCTRKFHSTFIIYFRE